MPLPKTKNVGKLVKELQADNKKKGKARGAGGKPRPPKQILAIALTQARKSGAKIPKSGTQRKAQGTSKKK